MKTIEIITRFKIAPYCVTNTEFNEWPDKPSDWVFDPLKPRHPATMIDYNTAEAYAAWRGCRLPTEQEHEIATRAGSTGEYYFGDLSLSAEYAWTYENASKIVQPVGMLKPNKWGLYDMTGNVWQWCDDTVVRGGCAWVDAWICRSAYRHAGEPGGRSESLGFRLAADA